jgi:hypothetical protein
MHCVSSQACACDHGRVRCCLLLLLLHARVWRLAGWLAGWRAGPSLPAVRVRCRPGFCCDVWRRVTAQVWHTVGRDSAQDWKSLSTLASNVRVLLESKGAGGGRHSIKLREVAPAYLKLFGNPLLPAGTCVRRAVGRARRLAGWLPRARAPCVSACARSCSAAQLAGPAIAAGSLHAAHTCGAATAAAAVWCDLTRSPPCRHRRLRSTIIGPAAGCWHAASPPRLRLPLARAPALRYAAVRRCASPLASAAACCGGEGGRGGGGSQTSKTLPRCEPALQPPRGSTGSPTGWQAGPARPGRPCRAQMGREQWPLSALARTHAGAEALSRGGAGRVPGLTLVHERGEPRVTTLARRPPRRAALSMHGGGGGGGAGGQGEGRAPQPGAATRAGNAAAVAAAAAAVAAAVAAAAAGRGLGGRGSMGKQAPGLGPGGLSRAAGSSDQIQAAGKAAQGGGMKQQQQEEEVEAAAHTKYWGELTAPQRAAAAGLGWSQRSWNAGEMVAVCRRHWSVLSEAQRQHASAIGYTQCIWDAGTCVRRSYTGLYGLPPPLSPAAIRS